jgi:hypothetical protein
MTWSRGLDPAEPSDTGEVENLRAWLTTVVGRIALNMLRARLGRCLDRIGSGPADSVDPMDVVGAARSFAPFVFAGLLEIGGGYLVKEKATP